MSRGKRKTIDSCMIVEMKESQTKSHSYEGFRDYKTISCTSKKVGRQVST